MKTNTELAREMKTTSRQISKSRKRGFITTVDGVVVKYTAPVAAHKYPKSTGVIKNKKGGVRKWAGGVWDQDKATFKGKK